MAVCTADNITLPVNEASPLHNSRWIQWDSEAWQDGTPFKLFS